MRYVICSKTDEITVCESKAVIVRKGVPVILESENGEFRCPEDMSFRNFNVVGGFGTFPLYMKLKKGEAASFTLQI